MPSPNKLLCYGQKRRVSSIEEAHAFVRQQHPVAYRCGAVAHWLWVDRPFHERPLRLIAEAWPHRANDGTWWVRVCPPDREVFLP